ncbi:hypothetical protein KUTeg_006738 [Tegillarca granosa]|uniref:Uncharacterized protein n=1 Tax=Tegillarca granosa TaxID=220873 RepID=A0ABQ9FB68_TEGGR|nr:hypothetical protein KUTeg_006738 [Tegillarca granosa]
MFWLLFALRHFNFNQTIKEITLYTLIHEPVLSEEQHASYIYGSAIRYQLDLIDVLTINTRARYLSFRSFRNCKHRQLAFME